MNAIDPRLPPDLDAALRARGFTQLTSVQNAVLDEEIAGRDLRISSQTGSGKTVAIGLSIRELVGTVSPKPSGTAAPLALVITPTRELAKQVETELSWLFAERRARVACVTGGGGYRLELAAFQRGPSIVVGTPGRLLDHLRRKTIDTSSVGAVVLDEADRMLDMGFRDELFAIFDALPEQRRTHLVSATFPREVEALANRAQKDPIHVRGTPLGAANADIDHVVHLVRADEKLAALINLLLGSAGGQVLIFARTRADVAELAHELSRAGFAVAAMSGEMEQAERVRALQGFREGRVDALVATDVAARGIDVEGISHVLHVEPPSDPEAYTHRSGRTGRAGRKGRSAMLVTLAELPRAVRILSRARMPMKFEPVPSASDLDAMLAERAVGELSEPLTEGSVDGAVERLAERLEQSGAAAVALRRLLASRRTTRGAMPRTVTRLEPPTIRGTTSGERPARRERNDAAWRSYRVSWGRVHGADARRLLAMLCRRGDIEGRDIGAIRVTPTFSIVDVDERVAESFERHALGPDDRDPRIVVRRWDNAAPERGQRDFEDAPRLEGPPRERSFPRAPHRDGDASPRRPHHEGAQGSDRPGSAGPRPFRPAASYEREGRGERAPFTPDRKGPSDRPRREGDAPLRGRPDARPDRPPFARDRHGPGERAPREEGGAHPTRPVRAPGVKTIKRPKPR